MKVEILELAADATAVRDQFIQRAQAKSPDCDVLQADIIWIAEFAQQKWLLDLSDYANARKGEFIPSTLSSYDYDGKLWGLPQVTGAGLLYRRSDQVRRRPRHLAGALRAGRRQRRLRLPGRALRGPDLQLRRAVLRRRRADPLRGRQEGRVRLARRT